VLVDTTERLLAKAEAAKRPSKYVAFRNGDEPAELLRDVVAMANVGGGVIVTASPPDLESVREQVEFDDLEVASIANGTAIVVGPAGDAPLTLEDRAWFRHGARTAPATRDDLKRFMDRRLAELRRRLIVDIKRVIAAPAGSEIVAIERSENEQGEQVIRITTDEHAPLFRAVDFDLTHPYRQKELIAEVNRRLPEERGINSYEFQAIRKTYDIDPDFVHRPRFGTNQYSEALVEWLVAQIDRDREFIARARAQYNEERRRGRSRSATTEASAPPGRGDSR
jgi:hypothetical protein